MLLLMYTSVAHAQNNVDIRFVQTSPDSGPVDLYINNNLILNNVPFETISGYSTMPPGNHTIRVLKAGENPGQPGLLETTLSFIENRAYSLVFVGRQNRFEIVNIEDDNSPTLANRARVRYTHAVEGAGGVDVCIVDRTCFITNLNYKGSSTADLDATNYLIDIRLHNTNNIVMTSPNEPFRDGFFYACFVIGTLEDAASRRIICASAQTRQSGLPGVIGPPVFPPKNGAILAPEVAVGLGVALLLFGSVFWLAGRYFRKTTL